jgi:hypothetical protein
MRVAKESLKAASVFFFDDEIGNHIGAKLGPFFLFPIDLSQFHAIGVFFKGLSIKFEVLIGNYVVEVVNCNIDDFAGH